MIKQLLTILLFILISGTGLHAAEPFYYNLQLNVRTGYHMFGETDDWKDGREKILKEDVFRQNDANFKSTNVDTAQQNEVSGLMMFQVEGIMGINLGKFVKSLRKFRGFRAGYAFALYPFASNTSYDYSGDVIFSDPSAADPALQSKTYSSTIKIQDTMLLMGHSLSFYYFHEKGFLSRTKKNKLIPYAGIEIGVGILNGKRKLQMSTDPLSITTVADGANDYTYKATVQESFFNTFSLRLAPVIGAQYHLSGPHYLDVKIGFNIQTASMSLDRDGVITETAKDPSTQNLLITYSQKVAEETRESTYSQTGLFFLIGYTVGLK